MIAVGIQSLYAQDSVQVVNPDLLLVDSLAKADTIKFSINKNKKNKPIDFPVTFNSEDSIKFNVHDKEIYVYGNGDVVYDDIELKSEYINLDMDKREVYARGVYDSLGVVNGRPQFIQGRDVFDADSLRYNFKSKRGLSYGILTEQDEGYLHSERTKVAENKEIHIKGGKYTTCDEEHPHFYIAMTKAKVIPQKKIVTGPAYLVIEDIPTPLAIPFGFFPITKGRSAGIVIPTFGDDKTRGYFLKHGGVYFGFSDYADFKLTADVYSFGSWLGRLESRYRNRYRYNGNLELEYSSYVENEEREPYSFSIMWSHQQESGASPNGKLNANVNFQSMGHDKRNAKSIDEYTTNDISSSISYYRKLSSYFSTTLSITHNQSNRDSIVSISLPNLNFNMNSFSPFSNLESQKIPGFVKNLRVGYGMSAQNKVKTKMDSTFFSSETLDKFMYGIQHKPTISTSAKLFKYLTLSPSISYLDRWYFDKYDRHWDSNAPVVSGSDTTYGKIVVDTISEFNRVYNYSLGAGVSTTIYGMYRFKSKSIKAIRHVLTPSVSYSYSPDFADEKYDYYQNVQTNADGETALVSRYSGMMYGTPSQGKSESLSFSLGNNLEMKVRDRRDTVTGTRKIKLIESLALSGSYNFAKDSLQWSLINLSARTTLFERLTINYSASFDPYASSWDENKKSAVRIDELMWDRYDRLWRITSDVWSISPSLSLGPLPKDGRLSREYNGYYTYDVPWSMNVSYYYNLSRTYMYKDNVVTDKDPEIQQTLRVSGNFKLTPNISTSFNTGWDFETRKLTTTKISITRSLHCWVMDFDWIPFGNMQSIDFTIRVKANVLSDLKLDKSKNYGTVY